MTSTEIQTWTVSEPYIPFHGALLEAPIHDTAGGLNRLRLVDIGTKQIHFVDLDKGPESLKSFDTGDSVSWPTNGPNRTTADIDGDKDNIIVGAKYGFALLDKKTGKLEYVAKLWNDTDPEGTAEKMRLNDGAVDTRGRYWAGAMLDPESGYRPNQPVGILFRLDADLTLHRMLTGLTIPNGMGWNALDTTFYITDSPTRTIWAFDYQSAPGTISNRRPFFTLPNTPDYEGGVPDGFAMDSLGFVWSCVFGKGVVVRISPGGGEVVARVKIPTRCATCPTFVGRSLFVCSAKEEEPERFKEEVSLRNQGCLFRVEDVGVEGVERGKFRFKC
ncbi:MAG: hypothetical protein M1834_003622 [Cirrosporium novae-zelandiae]|nr:MAG: hypothetical protein M1834_003622 [Cirrosporium novae-zelandiae]